MKHWTSGGPGVLVKLVPSIAFCEQLVPRHPDANVEEKGLPEEAPALMVGDELCPGPLC